MGYYFRYLTQAEHKITIKTIEKAFQKPNSHYQIHHSVISNYADLLHLDTMIAHIEINTPEDEIFEDDIHELTAAIGQPQNAFEQTILKQIQQANTLIATEAIWQGTKRSNTLDKLDPLWTWLFQNYPGILQADGEGFYDSTGLVIARNFTL
jgi:hypothetical protein